MCENLDISAMGLHEFPQYPLDKSKLSMHVWSPSRPLSPYRPGKAQPHNCRKKLKCVYVVMCV